MAMGRMAVRSCIGDSFFAYIYLKRRRKTKIPPRVMVSVQGNQTESSLRGLENMWFEIWKPVAFKVLDWDKFHVRVTVTAGTETLVSGTFHLDPRDMATKLIPPMIQVRGLTLSPSDGEDRWTIVMSHWGAACDVFVKRLAQLFHGVRRPTTGTYVVEDLQLTIMDRGVCKSLPAEPLCFVKGEELSLHVDVDDTTSLVKYLEKLKDRAMQLVEICEVSEPTLLAKENADRILSLLDQDIPLIKDGLRCGEIPLDVAAAIRGLDWGSGEWKREVLGLLYTLRPRHYPRDIDMMIQGLLRELHRLTREQTPPFIRGTPAYREELVEKDVLFRAGRYGECLRLCYRLCLSSLVTPETLHLQFMAVSWTMSRALLYSGREDLAHQCVWIAMDLLLAHGAYEFCTPTLVALGHLGVTQHPQTAWFWVEVMRMYSRQAERDFKRSCSILYMYAMVMKNMHSSPHTLTSMREVQRMSISMSKKAAIDDRPNARLHHAEALLIQALNEYTAALWCRRHDRREGWAIHVHMTQALIHQARHRLSEAQAMLGHWLYTLGLRILATVRFDEIDLAGSACTLFTQWKTVEGLESMMFEGVHKTWFVGVLHCGVHVALGGLRQDRTSVVVLLVQETELKSYLATMKLSRDAPPDLLHALPSIVAIYTTPRPMVMMEYVPGLRRLSDMSRAQDRQDLLDRAEVVVSRLHESGHVHGNLNQDNIVYDVHQKRVMLLGCSRLVLSKDRGKDDTAMRAITF